MIEFITYKLLHLFISNHNEEKLIRILKTNKYFDVTKKIVVLDIGCYIGDWTKNFIYQLKKITKKKYQFYLFDANKKIKERVKKICYNKNIKFYNIALSKKKNFEIFNLNNFFQCSGSSLSNVYKSDNKWVNSRYNFIKFFSFNKKLDKFINVKVQTNTLDNICKKLNIKNIDVIKIDVEGSELDVLLGSKKNLKNVKIIYTEIVENKSKYLKKEKTIKEFLSKKGFKMIKKDDIGNVSLFSNIVAKDNIFINKKFFFKKIYYG